MFDIYKNNTYLCYTNNAKANVGFSKQHSTAFKLSTTMQSAATMNQATIKISDAEGYCVIVLTKHPIGNWYEAKTQGVDAPAVVVMNLDSYLETMKALGLEVVE